MKLNLNVTVDLGPSWDQADMSTVDWLGFFTEEYPSLGALLADVSGESLSAHLTLVGDGETTTLRWPHGC